MARAVNTLVEMEGGFVVVDRGGAFAPPCPLPVAGLMSTAPASMLPPPCKSSMPPPAPRAPGRNTFSRPFPSWPCR